MPGAAFICGLVLAALVLIHALVVAVILARAGVLPPG
jgi:hypothetical protein